jgi:hypothetical protein
MTIKEAALCVMFDQGVPLTPEVIYDLIIANGLYEFHSDNALHILKTQIRRYCQGLDFSGSSDNKCFDQTVDGRYFPLAWSITKSTTSPELSDSQFKKIFQAKIRSQTSIQRLIDARLGQGEFRRNLDLVWDGKCAVTGCPIRAMLKASHIKPWAKSSDFERLDKNNGLLLTANLDALFDQFLITFSENGLMLISSRIPRSLLAALGIGGKLLKTLNPDQIKYLNQHRKFFEQKEDKFLNCSF